MINNDQLPEQTRRIDNFDKLRRVFAFKVFRDEGINICHECEEPIATWEEMTLQHTIPWRNKPKDEALRLIQDTSLIKLAHPQCNVNDEVGESGYRGVYFHNMACKKKWQAKMTAKNIPYSLQYWETAEQAAIRRDLFAFEYYKRCCILNFKHLKQFYIDVVDNKKDLKFLEDIDYVKKLSMVTVL